MKKYSFRLQVVLDMRQKELEERQMEMAKILSALNLQQEKLQQILQSQTDNTNSMEALYNAPELDIMQIESHRSFGLKLINDARNQERVIENTKFILEKKQQEVKIAHQKVEVLNKLKEKQEKAFYKEFLDSEMKEIDDITSARFKVG